MSEDTDDAFASPPCLQHEVQGLDARMDTPAVLAELNRLLEGERAGARGLRDTADAFGEPALIALLKDVGRDEARYCAMLTGHIERLGGTPSRTTGVFYDKLMGRPDAQARLRLLDRGQKAVVDSLNSLLTQTLDRTLRQDLEEMRDVHRRNIASCADYLTPPPGGQRAG